MNTNPQPRSITEGVIWKQLLSFFFPILMGSFFQQMYNTVDTIIVGRAIGTQALAAVGSSASLINLVSGFFIGLSSGASVIVSQYYGADDREGTHQALTTGMILSVFLGILTMVIGIGMDPAVLRLIRTPDNCLPEAVTYVRFYFAGAIASMVYNMGTGMLRAMGDSRRPMLFLMFSCFLNIFLDYLFVVMWKTGVAGAALATALSQCISAVLVLITLWRLPDSYRLTFKNLRINRSMLGRMLIIGIPAGLQFTTYDLSNILTQSSVNSFGDVTGAAWIAYIKSDAIIWMIITAFGAAITTFAGQNFGARKYDRVTKSVRICMGISTAVVLSLSAAEVLFREWILGIYTTDPEVIRTGAFMILHTVPFCAFFLPVEVMGGAMRGAGYSLVPTIITTIFACVFRVLWVLLVVERLHSLRLLLICYPISWLMCALVFIAVYLRGKWLRSAGSAQDAVLLS